MLTDFLASPSGGTLDKACVGLDNEENSSE